ncbi:hypothetical protein F5884DRAFT_684519 [Xylogone sp. PMI_703]|nr:hypothetical protein F5884DRAFT_684519 [Xylogone sp. PMI_703]
MHQGYGHKKNVSGGIMSKFPFLRMNSDERQSSSPQQPPNPGFSLIDDQNLRKSSGRAMAAAISHQRTRKRKGSLRKAALLGRGAQREKRETKAPHIDTDNDAGYGAEITLSPTSPTDVPQPTLFGLGISDDTPRPSMDGYASRTSSIVPPPITLPMGSEDHMAHSLNGATSPTLTYTSTTDEDDILSIPRRPSPPLRNVPQFSSGSESYYGSSGSLPRRRSSQKPKSPLSLGPAATPIPSAESEWDYSETEWWGWVVLIVTWVVFVVGMGSCLGIWSWAWDVGETPYAPPEFEDDPTLPIVGYYPALIILTAVMAWVWVVVAWVGMKYFRHAKISGD